MNTRRLCKVLSLPLRMVAGWASPAPLRFGTQTSRARGVLSEASFAILLLLGAVLLPAAPAPAQTQPIVSNLGQAGILDVSGGFPYATPFTTGSRGGGYILTEAVVHFRGNTPGVTVSIYNTSGNLPGTSIGTLDGLTLEALDQGLTLVSAAGVHTFTSSVGIPLAASTTYYLAVDSTGGAGFSFTNSTNQTTTDGWDIINRSARYLATSTWMNDLPNFAHRFSLSIHPFDGRTIANQIYVVDTAITDLTLPPATVSSGDLRYMLEPDPPAGLSFSTATRVLSGTPAAIMAAATYTYTATIANGSTSLSFTIAVVPRAVRLRLRVFLEGPLQ